MSDMPETVGLSTKNKVKHLFKMNTVLGINWHIEALQAKKKNGASGSSEGKERIK